MRKWTTAWWPVLLSASLTACLDGARMQAAGLPVERGPVQPSPAEPGPAELGPAELGAGEPGPTTPAASAPVPEMPAPGGPASESDGASAIPAQPDPMVPVFETGAFSGQRLTDAAREVDVPRCELRPDEPMPADATDDPDACALRYLGDWVRCDGQAGELVEVADVRECLLLCRERDDCTSVEELFWAGLPLCVIITSPCETVWTDVWFEEDGARAYRKECCGWETDTLAPYTSPGGEGLVVDAGSGCRFELAEGKCAGYAPATEVQHGEASLSECLSACQADESCQFVSDPWSGTPFGHECILYSSDCDNLLPNDVPEHHYRKVCQGS